jgi:hypothetical protein
VCWIIAAKVILKSQQVVHVNCEIFINYSNIYQTRCNVTQFISSGNCSTCVGWYHHPSSGTHKLYLQHLVFVTPLLVPAAIAAGTSNQVTVVCAPDDGWWYHPKHVQQFPDEINCVTLHLVGYILAYS